MSLLLDEIEQTTAKLAQLKLRAAKASCAEVGHRWKSVGGANAGCGLYCSCSTPVRECEVCGESDYGEPARAEVIAWCQAAEYGPAR